MKISRKTLKKLIVLSGIIFTINLFATVYYIPHIHTGSDAWETYLIIDNPTAVLSSTTVYYYDSTGNLISKEKFEVNPYETKKIALRQIGAVAAKVYNSTYSVRVRVGYIAKESLGGGTAEFSPATKLSNRMVMNTSNYYDALTWSGFALWNGTDKDITATLYAYSDAGNVAQETVTIPAHQKIVDFFDSFFGLDTFKDISSVIVEADYPGLCGVVISGKDNDKLLFSAPRNIKYFVEQTEYIDGEATFSNMAYTSANQNIHFFISREDLGKVYYCHYGTNSAPDDSLTAEEFGSVFTRVRYIFASKAGDAIYALGTYGLTVKVCKITADGAKVWEKEIGSFPGMSLDPDDYKIFGAEHDGKVFIAFKDYSSLSGVHKILDGTTGNEIASRSGLTETAIFGGATTYTDSSNNTYFVSAFSYYTDRLQLLFYDTNGNLVKQIFSQSPLPDASGIENRILGIYTFGGKIFLVVGKEVPIDNGWRKLHLYLVSVSFSDTTFDFADVTDLNTFVPFCSSAIIFNSLNFSGKSKNKAGYPYTLQIITVPYLPDDTSTSIMVNLDTSYTPANYPYFTKRLPYTIHGYTPYWFSIYIIASEKQYLTYDEFRTKAILRLLYTYDLLNY